ncbi:general secretion pathway protein GspK, partial [Verrucomicrobia bacterium]|nr:general secretion pathway protein GspK [Verrucomicrobiota bacterium]
MRITRNPFHSERGIALVMVMVVILAFGVLAASYAFSMKVEVRLAANTTRDPDMEWLGRSGIELARFVLAEKMQIPMQGQFDALSQMWAGGPLGTNEVLMAISLINVPLGEGMISVRIKDLERKININIADEPLLQRTMQVMGVDPFAADMIVDSVLDWMDPDLEPRLNGADGEAYLSEPNPP